MLMEHKKTYISGIFFSELFFSLSLLFSFLIYSCSPEYIPNMINSPLLTNKGQLNVSGAFEVYGGDIQGAYALTDHIGIMANLNSTLRLEKKHNIIEFGAGFYQPLNNIRLELYSGYGMCTSFNGKKYNRFFLQPTICFSIQELDISFAVRLTNLKLDFTDTLNRFITGKYSTFCEPAFTIKIGEEIKIFWQFGCFLPVNKYAGLMISRQDFNINIGCGVQFEIGKKSKAKKTPSI